MCKRQPTELQEALRLAHECVEIEKWMAHSVFRQQWSAKRVNEMQDELAKLKAENEKLRQRLSAKDELAADVKAQTMRTLAEIEASKGFVVRSAGKSKPVAKLASEGDDSSSIESYSTDSDDLFDNRARNARRAQNKQSKKLKTIKTANPGENEFVGRSDRPQKPI